MKTGEGFIQQIAEEFHGIKAEIVSHQVWEMQGNALLITLPQPSCALSGRQGFRKIRAVCNSHLPKPLWQLLHQRHLSWKAYLRDVLREVLAERDLPVKQTAVLSTGVNMAHLAWAEEVFQKLWVLAFVTAGVKTNALRIGRDSALNMERNGQFEKVGTINTILLTNARLNSSALAASFITVTEAKVVALQEMDIRSTYQPAWQATGTGTDQIVTVSGHEIKCSYVGGHAKMGELMARAVTTATISAIEKNLKAPD